MLVAFTTLTGGHSLTTRTLGGLSGASNGLVLEMAIRFADRTGTLTRFLRRRKAHIPGVAR